MSSQPSKAEKKKDLVDFISKKRDVVCVPIQQYTKDEALTYLAEILIEAYFKKKRYEQTK